MILLGAFRKDHNMQMLNLKVWCMCPQDFPPRSRHALNLLVQVELSR
jgi:hypothetical protein